MQIRTLALLLIFSSLTNAYQFGGFFIDCEECWLGMGVIEISLRVTAIVLVLTLGLLVWFKKHWSRYFVYLYSVLAAGSLLFIYLSFLFSGAYQSNSELIRATVLAILTIAIATWACFVASKLKSKENG